MASGPNAELVRRALLAQNRTEDDVFRAALAPDIVWHAGTNEFGLPQLLHGPDEVVAAMRDARARGGGLTATLHEVREDGDDVLVIGTLSGGGRTMPRAWLWTIRDGHAVRVRAFNGRGSALRAWEDRAAADDEG